MNWETKKEKEEREKREEIEKKVLETYSELKDKIKSDLESGRPMLKDKTADSNVEMKKINLLGDNLAQKKETLLTDRLDGVETARSELPQESPNKLIQY